MALIITFSGTDGAGKSTQIHFLETHLKSQGIKTSQFWARGGYTPLFSFLKDFLRRLQPGKLPKSGPSQKRSEQFKSARVRKAWLLVAILDLILCYVFWLRIRKWSGYTVICDRYIDDSLLDFNRNFPQENVESWRSWRLLKLFSPIPDARFLLIVPPEESARRSKLKNEPFPDSRETLEWRYERYQEMAASSHWKTLDCQVSIEAVREKIIETLKPCA